MNQVQREVLKLLLIMKHGNGMVHRSYVIEKLQMIVDEHPIGLSEFMQGIYEEELARIGEDPEVMMV